MTKSDLIQIIINRLNLQPSKAEQIVNIVFDQMVDALNKGERIEIRGFGVFEVRSYKGYQGRNPRTGESTDVAPKRLPFFKVGKELRERVAEGPKEKVDSNVFDPSNAEKLYSPERREAIPEALIKEMIDPNPGIILADVGTGTGYFLWPLLEAVEGQGTFYAVDTSEEMLEKLKAISEHRAWGEKIEYVKSQPDHIPLPEGSLDVILLGSVYHELQNRIEFLRVLKRLLRPDGRVVIVDWKPMLDGGDDTVGPKAEERLSRDVAHREMIQAGFEIRTPSIFQKLWTLVGIMPEV